MVSDWFCKEVKVPPKSIFASYFPVLPIILQGWQVTKSVVKPEVEELQHHVGFSADPIREHHSKYLLKQQEAATVLYSWGTGSC